MAGPLRRTYVDEARTHEARFLYANELVTIVELGLPDRDPEAALQSQYHASDEWDARAFKVELEARLGMMGAYWATDGNGWRPVSRRPQIVDLRSLDVPTTDGRRAGIHLFHHPASLDRMLLAVPGERGRASIAEVDLRRLEPISARVLHEGLALGPLRSLLARENLRAHDAGYAKLLSAHDLSLVYGPDWQARLSRAASANVRALPTEPPRIATQEDGEALVAAAQKVLGDPRLVRIHMQFLEPREEDEILAEGEYGINKAIQAKRRNAPFHDQHLLSVLEASLLLRQRLLARAKLDPALVHRVERLAYYLPA
jgi:hypothetical protein